MRAYETATIWSTSLSDSELEKELARVQKIIVAEDGTFRNTDSWGRRQLAYPIRKQTEGFYVFLIWDGDDRVTAGIDKHLRINEACLRYLTLRRDRSDDSKAPSAPVASKRAAAPVSAVEEPVPAVEEPADAPVEPAAEPSPEEEKTQAAETAAEPPLEEEKSTSAEAAVTLTEEPETAPEAKENKTAESGE